MQNTTRKTLKNHKTMPKMAQLGRNRLKTQSSGVFLSFPEIRAVLEGSCQISLKIPENQLMGPTLGAKKNCIPCGIELGAHSGTDGPRWPCRWKRARSTLTIEVFVHTENLPYSSSSVRDWVTLGWGSSGAAVRLGPRLASACQDTSKNVRTCPGVFGFAG